MVLSQKLQKGSFDTERGREMAFDGNGRNGFKKNGNGKPRLSPPDKGVSGEPSLPEYTCVVCGKKTTAPYGAMKDFLCTCTGECNTRYEAMSFDERLALRNTAMQNRR
jgi:hypothetical protein